MTASKDTFPTRCVCVSTFEKGDLNVEVYPVAVGKCIDIKPEHEGLSVALRVLEAAAKTSFVEGLQAGLSIQDAYRANTALRSYVLPLLPGSCGPYTIHKDYCRDSDYKAWDPRGLGIQIPATRAGDDLQSPTCFIGLSHYDG